MTKYCLIFKIFDKFSACEQIEHHIFKKIARDLHYTDFYLFFKSELGPVTPIETDRKLFKVVFIHILKFLVKSCCMPDNSSSNPLEQENTEIYSQDSTTQPNKSAITNIIVSANSQITQKSVEFTTFEIEIGKKMPELSLEFWDLMKNSKKIEPFGLAFSTNSKQNPLISGHVDVSFDLLIVQKLTELLNIESEFLIQGDETTILKLKIPSKPSKKFEKKRPQSKFSKRLSEITKLIQTNSNSNQTSNEPVFIFSENTKFVNFLSKSFENFGLAYKASSNFDDFAADVFCKPAKSAKTDNLVVVLDSSFFLQHVELFTRTMDTHIPMIYEQLINLTKRKRTEFVKRENFALHILIFGQYQDFIFLQKIKTQQQRAFFHPRVHVSFCMNPISNKMLYSFLYDNVMFLSSKNENTMKIATERRQEEMIRIAEDSESPKKDVLEPGEINANAERLNIMIVDDNLINIVCSFFFLNILT